METFDLTLDLVSANPFVRRQVFDTISFLFTQRARNRKLQFSFRNMFQDIFEPYLPKELKGIVDFESAFRVLGILTGYSLWEAIFSGDGSFESIFSEIDRIIDRENRIIKR